LIGKNFVPGETAIDVGSIAITLEKELDKLISIYELLKSATS
jgi:hypothetical protein